MSGAGDRTQQCNAEGCTRIAGPLTGMCSPHARVRRHHATSDGRPGVKGAPPKMSDDDVTAAKQMYAAFKTRQAIAKHFGVGLTYLRERMRGDR